MSDNRINRQLMALVSAALLGGCSAGPDYQRPALQLPEQWAAQQASDKAAKAASERWWVLYADPVLDKLEDEALAHNMDVAVALARVMEVRAQLDVAESAQYPNVSANASEVRNRATLAGSFPRPSTLPRTQTTTRATLDASYEVDLWGKYRRSSEAARAELLAAEANRDAVRLTLTAQVAQQYFALLAYSAQEQAVQRTLVNREERLVMDKKRLELGVISEFQLHQAEAELAAAQAQLANITLARERQETALALLLGRAPREVMNVQLERGTPVLQDVWVPDGLPSDLLLRRPDLKAAEQKLIAQNARIGEVRSQYFPSISLTGYLGSETVDVAKLFTGPAGVFQFAAGISQPIFNAGRISANVKASEARRDQALAQYQQAVASAFGDVRNALAAQSAARKVLEAESMRSQALTTASKQAEIRLQVGSGSRMEFLDVERNQLQAELNRIEAERAQRVAVADLFKALGGGWQK
ncbi:MAG TPA: efflux transporter outer membrane subunit [Sideroxyarcus sp.]|nr:efflux transporter outer membrane subunit [Sideroxyarcus sp.]